MTENKIGNSTTIINTIIVTIAGYIFSTYGAFLLNYGIDQTMLIQIIGTIIAIIFAIINAKYPNSFDIFENNNNTIEVPTTLTPEQEQEIINLIHYYDNQIEDIDPSIEYEEDNDGC